MAASGWDFSVGGSVKPPSSMRRTRLTAPSFGLTTTIGVVSYSESGLAARLQTRRVGRQRTSPNFVKRRPCALHDLVRTASPGLELRGQRGLDQRRPSRRALSCGRAVPGFSGETLLVAGGGGFMAVAGRRGCAGGAETTSIQTP